MDHIVSDKKTRSIRGHAVEIIGVRETGNPQVSKTLRSEFNSRGPCQNKKCVLLLIRHKACQTVVTRRSLVRFEDEEQNTFKKLFRLSSVGRAGDCGCKSKFPVQFW